MTGRTGSTGRGERGAVLVHVAIALLALLAFSALAIDYGIMWVSRNQAQNTADAAALAAATSIAFDDLEEDLAVRQARARTAAQTVVQQNLVWGEAPDTQDGDVTFPPCPPGAPGPPDTCVRVDTYRNQERGNPLPVFFIRLAGVTSQGVRATAQAQLVFGNASNCLKPWAVPDKWDEIYPVPKPAPEVGDVFDKYDNHGDPVSPPDVYVPPYVDGATGYALPDDYGAQLVLKAGNPQDAIAPGWFLPVDLPRPGSPITGGDKYRENIASCNMAAIPISTPGSDSFLQNEPGNMIGPTKQGVDALVAQDPFAHWSSDSGVCGGNARGCVAGSAFAISPRVVALPVFDVETYVDGQTSGRVDIRIVNILGFFVEGMSGNDVIGYLVTNPHVVISGNSQLDDRYSFLRTVILVR